jgi:peptidoglycan DL-endopeptidase CwlO
VADVLASAVAIRAVGYCRQALGTPYAYGQSSPSGYDCSGLVYAAYRSTGRTFNWRSSEQQYGAGFAPVQWGHWAPGDLIFWQFPSDTDPSPGHVVIYAGRGWTIQAPFTGEKVQWYKVADYGRSSYVGSARPFPLPDGVSAPAQGPKINPTPGVAGYDPTVPDSDQNVTDPSTGTSSGDSNDGSSTSGLALGAGIGGFALVGILILVGLGAIYYYKQKASIASDLPLDAPGGGA